MPRPLPSLGICVLTCRRLLGAALLFATFAPAFSLAFQAAPAARDAAAPSVPRGTDAHEKPAAAARARPAPAAQAEPAAQGAPAAPVGLRARMVQAQIAPRLIVGGRVVIGAAGSGADDADAVVFPTDRESLRSLELAKGLIADERFTEAARILDDLLRADGDYFFQPDRGARVYRSLKAEARRLIGALSDEGRASYELLFAAAAAQDLAAALSAGDQDRLAAVSRRYFHTAAGRDATWLLARQHLDHGRPLAAALCFELLGESAAARTAFGPALPVLTATSWLRAGVADRAAKSLIDWGPENASMQLPDKLLNFSSTPDALQWLQAAGGHSGAAKRAMDDWPMLRGDSSRNGDSSGDSPLLNPRWRSTMPLPLVSEASPSDVSKQLRESPAIPNLPSEHPLAVAGSIVARTPTSIVGIDFRTGKRVWEYETWESEESDAPSRSQVFNQMTGQMMTVQPQKYLARSTLSSDGQRVFLIEERGGSFSFGMQAMNPFMRGGPATGPGTYNKLSARELATQGKLLWEVGGATGEDEPKLAGVSFLGPPLPLGGQIHVLGENRGEVCLYVLDSATGRLDWQQPLAIAETPIGQDPARRLTGASPSFAGGVLICPTGSGAVVAVELANRSLLWGYQYGRNPFNPAMAARRGMPLANPFTKDRWADGSALIDGNRILVTPQDSDQLHCLNLLDGALLWSVDRGDNLYLACVRGETAVLVGRAQARGIRLADGKPAWPDVDLAGATAAVPTGRGFRSGDFYHVPLSSAEVLKLNIERGRIESRARSRQGVVPGNLICYRGNVISQTLDSIDCFYQLDERERWAAGVLSERPDDPAALSALGEILLDQGKLAEGLAHLQRAYDKVPDERLRGLLVKGTMEGLRTDFPGFRAAAERLEDLLTDPAEQSEFARLMAVGLAKAGETLPAFGALVKMCQPEALANELEEVIPGKLSVRRDRWVQARLAELRATAPPELNARMDELIAARRAELGAPDSVTALQQFLLYFGGQPGATATRQALAARLAADRRWLEAEWTLLGLERCLNPPPPGLIWAKLAEMLVSADRHEDAAKCYRRLLEGYANEICVEGRTGKEIVDQLPADSPVRSHLETKDSFPLGEVEKKVIAKNLGYFSQPYELAGSREPFFADLSLEIDYNRQELVARDPWGAERFRVAVMDGSKNNRYFNPAWSSARAAGHVLLVQNGLQVLAVDTLSPLKDGKAAVLWRHDLSDSAEANVGIQTRWVRLPNGRNRMMITDPQGQPLGSIWPIDREVVCVQRGSRLLALDMLSGQVLWRREDMPTGAEVFGDHRVIVVVPSEGDYLLLRTLDGQEQGRVAASAGERIATSGDRELLWQTVDGKQQLRLVEPAASKTIWTRDFESGAKYALAGDDEIAVLQPTGRLSVLNEFDGSTRIDAQLDPEPTLNGLQVLRDHDRYLMMTSRPVVARNNLRLNPVQNNGLFAAPLVNGRVYSLERKGGARQWDAAVGATALVLNQPARSPVLVFAANAFQAQQQPSKPNQQFTSIVALDRRTGKVLCDEKPTGNTGQCLVSMNPEKQTVEIRTQTTSIELRFGRTAAVNPPKETPDKPNEKATEKEEEKPPANAAGQSAVPDPAPSSPDKATAK